MSHLTTIIARVENRLDIYGGDLDAVSKDPLWLQSIRNLKEYLEIWKDWTDIEMLRANELYEQFKQYLT